MKLLDSSMPESFTGYLYRLSFIKSLYSISIYPYFIGDKYFPIYSILSIFCLLNASSGKQNNSIINLEFSLKYSSGMKY